MDLLLREKPREPKYPIAVLIGVDDFSDVVEVSEPPPTFYCVPIPPRLSIEPDPDLPSMLTLKRRVFRFQPGLRERRYRWWRVYNEGHSETPESAYVYLEVAGCEAPNR